MWRGLVKRKKDFHETVHEKQMNGSWTVSWKSAMYGNIFVMWNFVHI